MTAAKRVTARHAVKVLNRIHAADPDVLQELIEHRVTCDRALASDPTVQLGRRGTRGARTLDLLGVLNGIFGISHCGYGFIQPIIDDEGTLVRFEVGD